MAECKAARLSKTQYQYTLVDVDSDELDHWAPVLQQKLQRLPQLTDVASDQQTDGRVMKIEVNRQSPRSLGINPSVVDSILYDAFGQRIAARLYIRLNQYFVILEVEPNFQLGPNAHRQRRSPALSPVTPSYRRARSRTPFASPFRRTTRSPVRRMV
jgi:multidrug efflux pump subunit AcrB